MRYFWLIGALVFSLSFADDGLGDLVRKTEGKKGGNKPAPSRESDTNSSPSRSSDDKGNKPRPSDNSAPQGGQGGAQDNDPFRKKPRSGSGNAPQPQQDNSGRVPLEGRRVPLEARPVPFESRPVLTPPSAPNRIDNRPVPLEGGDLPALVRRTEGLNPYPLARPLCPRAD
jgi:hypothetical protein